MTLSQYCHPTLTLTHPSLITGCSLPSCCWLGAEVSHYMFYINIHIKICFYWYKVDGSNCTCSRYNTVQLQSPPLGGGGGGVVVIVVVVAAWRVIVVLYV